MHALPDYPQTLYLRTSTAVEYADELWESLSDVRVHRTLQVTPAMEARVCDRLWSLDELVERTSN